MKQKKDRKDFRPNSASYVKTSQALVTLTAAYAKARLSAMANCEANPQRKDEKMPLIVNSKRKGGLSCATLKTNQGERKE